MMISRDSHPDKADFQRAAMSRFIDHMQRRGLKSIVAKKLKATYVGVVALDGGWKRAKAR